MSTVVNLTSEQQIAIDSVLRDMTAQERPFSPEGVANYVNAFTDVYVSADQVAEYVRSLIQQKVER